MSQPEDATVIRGPHATYFVSDDRVLCGASHGNGSAWAIGKATGALQKMFSLALGLEVFGSTTLTYGSSQHRLIVTLPPDERAQEEQLGTKGGHVTLEQTSPGTFEFHRAYQRHRFDLPGDLRVVETFFTPRTGFDDPAIAYLAVEITNVGAYPRDIVLDAYAMLRGTTPPDVTATYDAKLGALIAKNESQPDWVRVFGCTERPGSYQTMQHAENAYDSANVGALTNDTTEKGSITGALGVRRVIAPGETQELAFIHAFSEKGEALARKIFRAALDTRKALERTEAFFTQNVARSRVLTPDRTINDGAMWSKANMLRVLAMYPQGAAFTNEPGVSSNVVGRDVAWFTLGCDYLAPDVSKQLLLRFAKTQYPNGKLPEYFNAITGTVEDYGLNINDDTPLFVLACAHHYQVSGDTEFLDAVWPAVDKAADYICSLRDERGLIVCSASGENVFGIAGWRNVIPNASISGAVTEINAECFAALRSAARLAKAHGATADHYSTCADELRAAMNRHLVNPTNGMYVLNIGLDGDVHADVTGDEVFPVMFGVATPAIAYRVISRLNNPDFQTEAGLRTVSRLSPDYSPYEYVGLLGGVWPGLSFWYAFAAAKIYPDAMAHNLQCSYAQYLRDPTIYNTVPGQFSEWFDGESLVNRGMRLSPWEPPRYLWAAVEGACGLNISEGPEHYSVDPLMPSGWRWLAVRQIPLGRAELSYFIVRENDGIRVFATAEVKVNGALETYDDDVSDDVERLDPDVETVAFCRGDEWLICLGSTSDVAFRFPITIRRLRSDERVYTAHLFDSTQRRWTVGETGPGKEFANITLRIDARGFALIRLVPRA